MDKKCVWEDTGNYEYITSCKNEFHGRGLYELEDELEVLLFTFCPYCGEKIEHRTTDAIQN